MTMEHFVEWHMEDTFVEYLRARGWRVEKDGLTREQVGVMLDKRRKG
jgi:hypothetical protein